MVTILQTKLYVPRLAADLVKRPHLFAQLDHGLDRKLTLISAPAGYGKTTLIVQWLHNLQLKGVEIQNRVAWLSLDEHDDDLLRFLTYFAAAVQTVFPGSCSQTAQIAQLPHLPPLEYIAANLANELAELPEEFVVVLDDYYLITERSINQLLTNLLEYLPPQMHLVIVTRMDPPLTIAKLRVRQQLTEIRRKELAFTVDEVQTYLAKTMKQTFSREIAVSLRKRTEGWGAGLRMSILSMREKPDPITYIGQFTGSQHHVLAYLTGEVLQQQSQEINEFLLKTCILDRFNSCLSAAIMGKSESLCQVVLEQLEKSNLFIVPLDDNHEWFRYHHLFREVLQRRLNTQMSEDEIKALHDRATAWFAEQGSFEDALQHALAANNITEVVRLVALSRHNFLNHEQWYALERLLNLLPSEIEPKYADLLVARAWTLLMRLNLPAVPHLLEKVEVCLKQDPSLYTESKKCSLVGEMDAIWGMWGSWQNMEIDLIITYCSRAMGNISTEHTFARGIAYGHLGTALQLKGQSETAVRLLNEFINELPNHSSYSSSAWVSLLYVLFLSDELNQLEQTSHRLLKLGEKHHRMLSVGFAHYFCGWVRYTWNDLDMAIHHFSAVADLGYSTHLRALHDGMLGLALVYQAKGMPELASRTLENVQTFFLETNIPEFLIETESFQARLALLQGDMASALHWAQTVNLDTVSRTHMSLECPILTKARIFVVHGTTKSLEEAIQLIREQRHKAETTHNTRRLIEILPLQAITEEVQGQTFLALATLEKALILAEPNYAIRSFVDLGSPMIKLLYKLAEKTGKTTFISRILSSFPEIPVVDMMEQQNLVDAQDELIEALSERELEVLNLLKERLSDKEIGLHLSISPLTVRKHNHNIYQKIGVNSRKQAVARAKMLGLLQPH